MPDLTPTYVTVDPVTGLASAIFPGGVTIDAVFEDININPIGPSGNVVKWIKQSDGSAIAQIGAAQQVDLTDLAPEMKLVAIDPNSLQAAQLFLRSGANPNPARVQAAVNNGNGYIVTVVDSNGHSSFPVYQNGNSGAGNFAPNRIVFDVGSFVPQFPAVAAVASNVQAISHNLRDGVGSTGNRIAPTHVFLTYDQTLLSGGTFTYTTTTFSTQCRRVDEVAQAGNFGNCHWLAIAVI